MPIYLSPGVYPREIDLSALPTGAGPLIPAFIGTAKKGPMNEPILVTNAQQAIDVFGEPFPESHLMYAVLTYMQTGNLAYIMRVGVECEEGQDAELDQICIDTSGSKLKGWGRLPLFTGIDFGRINLREVSADNPLDFHPAAVGAVNFQDARLSDTEGPTDATLDFIGAYTGDVDDSFVILITSPPDSTAGILGGAGYQVVKNSTGQVVATGTLTEDTATESDPIDIGDGLEVVVEVLAGVLDTNDTFTFTVQPDNRHFAVSVEGGAASTYTMPTATYTTAEAFVSAINGLLVSEDYLVVLHTLPDGTKVPAFRTDVAGQRIQIVDTSAFALEVGTLLWAWDIPRSFLLGLDPGPYNITSQNNRVKINVIGESQTRSVTFSLATGIGIPTSSLALAVDVAGLDGGTAVWEAFELTVPGGSTHLAIVTTVSNQFDMLAAQANFSNIKTLRFCEEVGIQFPYKRAYRGFSDNRLTLPAAGQITPSQPLSCELDPLGADCASDAAYFENVVGWLVAPSAGTWTSGLQLTLEMSTEGPQGMSSMYRLTVRDVQGQSVDVIDQISFDKTNPRYIANLVNPGSSLGGRSGSLFVNWEERPAFLNNDVNTSDFEVRFPSQFAGQPLRGQADGIPLDPAYSSDLDAAVVGSPALSTGLYAFQNPESIDANMILTPGFSTGAVIGTALQICESRGDAIYLVDPPFGLRPQQVVDWHNGMLLSDLSNAVNSSYGALYWSWVRVFDQFSRQEVWVPPSGHVASVFSRTAAEAEQWFAPAGLSRGRLLTALDVEYSPTQGERDLLYGFNNAVNPIVRFPQDGIVIWGQRTLQRADTALDRVNVRMLLIFLKKSLTRTLRNFIFEPNDRALWSQVTTSVEPFLRDIQNRRGINAFRVVVDETNNTPERIDRNELWVTIFIQPTRTVEFIALNLVVLRTGASFAAEEALAAGGIVA